MNVVWNSRNTSDCLMLMHFEISGYVARLRSPDSPIVETSHIPRCYAKLMFSSF